MGDEISPRRLALRFNPPAIIVEYSVGRSQQLYHHEIDLVEHIDTRVSTRRGRKNGNVDAIVTTLVREHNDVIGNHRVSKEQLARFVRKVQQGGHASTSTPAPDSDAARIVLPQADYNRVSDAQLRDVKKKMDQVFQQNIVRPGDAGYQYDKQVVFRPAQEASDWDDE
ncbi:TPA: hypothetical protein N0F65_012276 [Lagenidium giganteum]|uniref:Centrosomal protein of 19 kDa n=1 Tax=Lagenidium giganteum TaxID=4803 RepID=A0AAV2ZB90_9STRA|nr:TPA: hypothetical protein N0F65_012276 [Lagenidium giganteum]